MLAPLTISCGVAFYPEDGDEDLYTAAHEAITKPEKCFFWGVVGLEMNKYDSCRLSVEKLYASNCVVSE
ncbi:hypothetical protein [Pseudanabaena sp. SR411]|uniref:hypothetical protein n=1 Tax=Pseudanabaena sp. SR411 TaxID=1980935 RepID=UPI0011406316|nr:hypothetical protein [Pseudanabaena sp. SR411]